jgi:hypothetical protein
MQIRVWDPRQPVSLRGTAYRWCASHLARPRRRFVGRFGAYRLARPRRISLPGNVRFTFGRQNHRALDNLPLGAPTPVWRASPVRSLRAMQTRVRRLAPPLPVHSSGKPLGVDAATRSDHLGPLPLVSVRPAVKHFPLSTGRFTGPVNHEARVTRRGARRWTEPAMIQNVIQNRWYLAQDPVEY